MKKLLLILLCLPLIFSCVNDTQIKKITKKNIADSLSENVVIGFSITSKNSELTSKTGTNVSINEMTTKNVDSGDKILFKNFQFTLDNKIEGALNFYSNNGKLMCNIPTELSVMSMPPDANGTTNYSKGDNIEFSGVSLVKINSINFVISDIRFNDNTVEKKIIVD